MTKDDNNPNADHSYSICLFIVNLPMAWSRYGSL